MEWSDRWEWPPRTCRRITSSAVSRRKPLKLKPSRRQLREKSRDTKGRDFDNLLLLMNLRKAAERLSRGTVFKRRLPSEFHGLSIYVSPEASFRYWLRMSQIDPMLYPIARQLFTLIPPSWSFVSTLVLFLIAS